MESVNEHFAMQDAFDANCASCVEDKHLEDGTCVLHRLM
jgi:hypothetical protein